MPFLSPDDSQMDLGQRGTMPNAQADESPEPGLAGAAFRRSNLFGTLYERAQNPKPAAPKVPDFDPVSAVPKGYESVAPIFASAQSPQDMEYIRQQYDREQTDNKIIQSHGGWGLAASMGMGLVDPVTLASMAIPLGGEARLAHAAYSAVSAGATTAAQAALQAQMEVSPVDMKSEALNVAGSAVLGGVLGGLLRPHLSSSRFDAMSGKLDGELHEGAGETVLGPIDGRQRIFDEATTPKEMRNVPPITSVAEATAPKEGGASASASTKMSETTYAPIKPGADLGAYKAGTAAIPEADLESIKGLGDGYTIEPGIQRVPISEFSSRPGVENRGSLEGFERQERARVDDLSAQIQDSGRMDPLIVVRGADGTYVLEGGHRLDAAREIRGATDVPAMVVREAGIEAKVIPALPDVPTAIGEEHINPNAESTAGAAATMTPTMRGESIARGAVGVDKALGFVSPASRVGRSPSIVARQVLQELVDLPGTLTKNWNGLITGSGSPIERNLWLLEGTHWQGIQARNEDWKAYRQRTAKEGGEPMNRGEFGVEVSKAMRNGDSHAIPEVAKSAATTRKIVFDPLKQRAIKNGLLPEGVTPQGADSYLMRQYDYQKIRSNRTGWTNTLVDGFRRQGVDVAEARDIAEKVTRNVLGSERGTMDWKLLDGIQQSGQLKERTLNLPDNALEPFLNNNIDQLSHSYLRSMGPEVEMTERFGSRDMKDQISDIHDDYARMMTRAPDDAAKAALQARSDADMRDLTAMRDRLYGIYGQPKDPSSAFVRAGRLLRGVNAARLLGAATLAHFPDVANVMMRYGMGNTFAAIAKVLTSGEAMSMTRNGAKRLGVGLDVAMAQTSAALGDYASHSQFAEQRIMNKITRGYTIATGETPLITMVQQLTSTMAQDELIRSAQKVAAGRELAAPLMARMASAGLDKDMLLRFAAEHEANGAKVNGLNFGMSDQWKDTQAAHAFESAVLREAHSVTLRPGVGSTPLFMSTEWGKSLRQFTTFGYAAQRSVVNPLMQGLAHGDPRAVTGIFALAAAGTLSYVTKQLAAGQPIEDPTSPKFAEEVLDKSNLMGWTSDYIFPGLWLMGNNTLSRWSDRDPVETIMGPSAGTLASIYKQRLPAKFLASAEGDVGMDTDEKGVNRADVHFMRRLMPGQNHWLFRNGINALEDRIGDTFDLPGKSNADRAAETAQ